MENSEPPSEDTSRLSAAVVRGWKSVIAMARRTGRSGRPSGPPHIEILGANKHPDRDGGPYAGPGAGDRLDGTSRQGPHVVTMSGIKSICVYCASGPGTVPAFMDAA